MRRHSFDSRLLVLSVFLSLILACNMPIIPQTGSDETPSAGPPTNTVQPPTNTVTATATPTETATVPPITPTFTVTSTNTPIPNTPTNTTVPTPCNRAQYVADVNYPDGTEIIINSNFTKTWRLTNTGSCTWTSGYKVIYVSGDQMSAPLETTLTSGTVPPGATVDISVALKAPASEGTYKGYFRLKSSENIVFGIGSSGNDAFWVEIKTTFLHILMPVVPMLPFPSKTPTPIPLQFIPHIKVTFIPLI
jgi:hypothetical protein